MDNEHDFADQTILWFERLFPTGAALNAFFAFFSGVVPGAGNYLGSKFASVAVLLFILNTLLCAGCGVALSFRKADMKAALRTGGKNKVLISLLSLASQELFLIGIFFIFMTMIDRILIPGIIGTVISGLMVFGAAYAWFVQLKESNKGISLGGDE